MSNHACAALYLGTHDPSRSCIQSEGPRCERRPPIDQCMRSTVLPGGASAAATQWQGTLRILGVDAVNPLSRVGPALTRLIPLFRLGARRIARATADVASEFRDAPHRKRTRFRAIALSSDVSLAEKIIAPPENSGYDSDVQSNERPTTLARGTLGSTKRRTR